MRSAALALFISLACTTAAEAGAWLRAEGSGFGSSYVSTDDAGDLSTGFYLEYGLSDTFTLGADVYYGSDLTTYLEGSGILFLRFPLGPTDRTNKWAAHVGVGARYLNLEYLPATEIGLSWGRGIEWGGNYGWLNLDTSYNDAQSPAQARTKADGTLGLSLSPRSKVMLQVFNTVENGKTYSKVAPSYLFAPGGGNTTLQLSLEAPVSGGGNTTLKLGVWLEF